MNTMTPQKVVKDIQAWIASVREQRFFRDKLSLAILVPTLLLNAATILIMIFRLRPANFQVPGHYSTLNGFDSLGPWYQAYAIALFALAITVVNTTLATRSFTYSRITSFFLIAGAFVVGLFCLIIGTAFAVIV
jgi:hypothetical protein